MDLFEYLGVLISVVVGLGVVQIFTGLATLIQERDEHRIDWIHLVWTLGITTYLLSFWWYIFTWSALATWTYSLFVFFVTYALVLYLMSGLLFPHRPTGSVDFAALFMRNRAWFFGLSIAATLLDIVEVMMKAEAGLRPIPSGWWPFTISILVLSAIGMRSDNRRFHGFFALYYLFAGVGYSALVEFVRGVAS